MEDKELLIRQSVLLEEIGKKIDSMEKKIDSYPVYKEKTRRLENIVYGSVAFIIIQLVAELLWVLQHKN